MKERGRNPEPPGGKTGGVLSRKLAIRQEIDRIDGEEDSRRPICAPRN